MSKIEGCGGRLCRALHWQSVKFECVRYAVDDFGGIDKDNAEMTYNLCGKICCRVSSGGSAHVDIPGRCSRSYSASPELLVISSSAEIETGDVICGGGNYYRIVEKISDSPTRFSLENMGEDFADEISV